MPDSPKDDRPAKSPPAVTETTKEFVEEAPTNYDGLPPPNLPPPPGKPKPESKA